MAKIVGLGTGFIAVLVLSSCGVPSNDSAVGASPAVGTPPATPPEQTIPTTVLESVATATDGVAETTVTTLDISTIPLLEGGLNGLQSIALPAQAGHWEVGTVEGSVITVTYDNDILCLATTNVKDAESGSFCADKTALPAPLINGIAIPSVESQPATWIALAAADTDITAIIDTSGRSVCDVESTAVGDSGLRAIFCASTEFAASKWVIVRNAHDYSNERRIGTYGVIAGPWGASA